MSKKANMQLRVRWVPEEDPVAAPAHYTFATFQPLDVILDWGLDFLLGNALKYIARAGKKTPDPREDIKKAIFYLETYINECEQKTRSNQRSGTSNNPSAKR